MNLNIPHLVLVVFGFGCFVLGATNLVSGENRLRVMSAGLAFIAASFIF